MKSPGEASLADRWIRAGMKQAVALSILTAALAACGEPVSLSEEVPATPGEPTSVLPEGYVATPAGLYHQSCVYEVPAGATVERGEVIRMADGTSYQVPPCKYAAQSSLLPGNNRVGSSTTSSVRPPTVNGWVEYTEAWASIAYKRIVADWNVPPNPTGSYGASGKVYYTFPGLQSDSFIIQPVLQYGNNGSYGGAYWTITSWRCDTGPNCFHSTPVTVSSGTSIHGDVTASGCSGGNCTWTITTTNTNTGQSTIYTTVDTEDYWRANSGVVEAYGITSCQDYPVSADYNQSGVFYRNVAVYDNAYALTTPTWSTIITPSLTPQCGYSVTATSTTASLYHSTNPVASISGPTSVLLHQSPQYTANVRYGLAPFTYQWRSRQSNGSYGAWSSWYSTGTTNYTYASINSCGLFYNDLEVMVTDAQGRTSIADIYITVSNPC